MYAITGITGTVGGALARTLLAAANPFAPLCATPRGDRRGPSAAAMRLDGFNKGWIDFEGENATVLNGQMNLETFLGALVLEAD